MAIWVVPLLFMGCATVIDTTSLETAQTLKPGKVKVFCYASENLNVHRLLYNEMFPPEDDEHINASKGVLGTKVGIGITPNSELDISLNLNKAAKLSYKHRLNGDASPWRFAVMPSLYYNKNSDGGYTGFSLIDGPTPDPYRGEYTAFGGDLSFLTTHTLNKDFSFTGNVKLAYNRINYFVESLNDDYTEYSIFDEGTFNSVIGSLTLTPKVTAGKIVIMPELGFYVIPTRMSELLFYPVFNLGLGFDMVNPN